ncbi:MATE family efflux transporter [Ilumatobacter sp.]|uniref:MATE family efflux transporter n=1 Tax=Ilumatobacter sp. TaxID=1967498 RepID=UPI003AF6A0DB
MKLAPVDRRILSLAIPALGSLAVEPVYVLVDTAIVGQLGTEQLAGLAIAATVLSFVFAGANFLTYGTTERVARRLGAGDAEAAANVGVQAMWLSLLFGLPAAPLLFLGARTISRWFGATGEVLDHAETYLSLSAVGVPFFLITLAAQGVLRGASDYMTPLWVLVGANVANLLIELVFVFGLDMGVAGSALSTVVAQTGAALVFVWILRPQLARASIRRPDLDGMRPLMSAGKYLLLRVGSMLGVFGGSTAIAARIDNVTLAAHQIANSLFIFLALTLDALAVPAQTIVAEELGREDVPSASHVADRAVRLSLWTGAGLGVLLALLAPLLPHVFTDDPAVVERATSALWWLSVALLPGAVAFAHDGILIGAGDYRFLGRAAFGYLLAVAPIGVLVLVIPSLGIAGIWGGLLVWMIIRAVVNDRRTSHVLA